MTQIACAAAVPASAIVTFLLTPVWRTIEERFGVESIGHSGPSDWCFVLVYVVSVLAVGATCWRVLRQRGRA